MGKYVLAALALALTVSSSPVLAGGSQGAGWPGNNKPGDHKGPYVSGGVGVSFLSDSDTTFFDINGDPIDTVIEFDSGYALSGAMGYRFRNDFRVEGEIGYRHHKVDKIVFGGSLPEHDEITNLSLMANAYRDFQTARGFTPYLGAGLGIGRVKANWTDGGTNHDTVFAYAAMAGVSVPVADSTSLTIEYKYLGTQDPNLGGADLEYDSHTIGAKLSYDF